jgi:hypothetical protein
LVTHDVELPQYRFNGDPKDNVEVVTGKHKQRLHCKYRQAKAKLEGVTKHHLYQKCLRCGDHICQPHFKLWHSKDD